MLIFVQNMASTVDFCWKPTTTAIFAGIRHVGVNGTPLIHHISQNRCLKHARSSCLSLYKTTNVNITWCGSNISGSSRHFSKFFYKTNKPGTCLLVQHVQGFSKRCSPSCVILGKEVAFCLLCRETKLFTSFHTTWARVNAGNRGHGCLSMSPRLLPCSWLQRRFW